VKKPVRLKEKRSRHFGRYPKELKALFNGYKRDIKAATGYYNE
jgi:hypothetical protein